MLACMQKTNAEQKRKRALRTREEVGVRHSDEHVRTFGWVAGIADWRRVVGDTHAAARTLVRRHDAALEHVEAHGTLPSGALPPEHRTGHAWLDLNAPPSKLGDAFRRLHAWVTDRHGSEPLRRVHGRRMEAARAAPRAEDAPRSMIASMVGAAAVGADPVAAARTVLETSNSHARSAVRRLADAAVGSLSNLPLVIGTANTSNTYSTYEAQPGGVDWLDAVAKYIVYGNTATHSNTGPLPSVTTSALCVQTLCCATCTGPTPRATAATTATARAS